MPPPTRVNNADYHFHAYDYAGAAARGPWGLSDAQPDRHNWRFYSMVQDLQGLLATAGTNGVPNAALTDVGGPILLGRTDRRTKQLAFGTNAAGAPTVVITGGIHAREWIAAEFVYLLAEYLIKNYKAAPPFVNGYQRQLSDIINSRRIRIIPMLNPHGSNFTVFSNNGRMWRKNRRTLPRDWASWETALTAPGPLGPVANPPFRNVQRQPPPSQIAGYEVPDYNPNLGIPPNPAAYRARTLVNDAIGVDLNRNTDTTAWGYDAAPANQYSPNYAPASPTYFGPNRGSETETGNLQAALAQAANPHLAASIDYHCYSKFVLYSGEAAYNGALGADYQRLGGLLSQLIRARGAIVPDYQLGTPIQLVRYNATGAVADRASQQYQSRAFTIELDPANTGQGEAGFDLPETDIRMVFEKNIRAALAALAAPAGYRPTTQAQLQLLAWNVYGRGNRLPT